MLNKLIKYIATNFDSATHYAQTKGVSPQHITNITSGRKPPTKDILKDIGLERIVVKKENYIELEK